MKKLKRGLLQLSLLLSVCSSSFGVTYYVSPAGNDSNPGTEASPFRSIARVNALDLEPGDTVLFQGGETFEGMIELDGSDSGAEGNIVTLGSYGTGRASINAGTGQGFSSGYSSYVKLQDLIFYGDGRKTGNTEDGVVFIGGAHVWIEDVDISGFQHAGLQFNDVDDFSALRVECYENGYAGIETAGNSWNNPDGWAVGGYIGYCKTYNNPGDPTETDNHSGNGIVLSEVKDVVVEYCESYNNGWDMPRSGNGPVGIWTWSVDNVLIQYCIAHNNKTSPNGLDGGGFDFDGGTRNSTIQYCLSYDNEGAGYGMLQFSGALDWYNNTVRYNLSYNDGTKNAHAGIALWKGGSAGEMRDLYIYNNTIYNDFGYAVEYFQNPVITNANFSNNIFIYKIAPVYGMWRDDAYTFNHYWDVDGEFSSGGYTSFTEWINSHTKERHDGHVVATWGDPLLSTQDVTPTLTDPSQLLTYNDFTPSFYSPVVDSGADLNSIYGWNVGTHDLGETSIPVNASYDRGAQELFPDGSNLAPYVTVGADQIIQLPTNQVALSGTVLDDGLPSNTVDTTWTKVSGSGTVDFASTTNINTTATFSEPDTYVLRLTATDGELSASNDVQITLLDEPVPGAVVAAINCGGNAYTATDGTAYSADTYFSGGTPSTASDPITATDDDALYQSERYGVLTYSIPMANGDYEVTLKMAETYYDIAGARVFDVSIEDTQVLDNLDLVAVAGHDVAYDRTFSATVSDSALTIKLLAVTENPKINAILVKNSGSTNNAAPVVDAGVNQAIQLPTDQLTLVGTVNDDGLPDGATVSTTWSQVSGDGTVTFGDANAVETTATFSAVGTYVLELTASDTELSSSDTVQVTVAEASDITITGNPFVTHMYTADPSAHVFDGKMYVYPSHDQDDATEYNMVDYHVFSSDDLNQWTDHGQVLHVDDVPWATANMWAPDAAYKDGTYYFYFPARDLDGVFRIGVATSNSPSGPFTPEAEPMANSDSIDPAVFTDDDGSVYMYWGGEGKDRDDPAVVPLDATMKQMDGAPTTLNITGAPNSSNGYFFEACWMHKHDGTYYLSYSTGNNIGGMTSQIAYATADNVYGPFTYQGILNGEVSGWTNHHSIVEWKGQSYLFYHNADLSGGDSMRRSIAADYLHYNEDGSIRPVIQTSRGIGSYGAFEPIRAINYHEHFGIRKVDRDDTTFEPAVGGVEDGDWLYFNNVDFDGQSAIKFNAIAASPNSGVSIEIRKDSTTGPLLGTLPVENTGGLQSFQRISCSIDATTGVQDIYLVFKGTGADLLNLDTFWFSKVTSASETVFAEAENYSAQSGIGVGSSTEGTMAVGDIRNGDWTAYNYLTLSGQTTFRARVSSNGLGGTIEIRQGSLNGPLLGTCDVPVTGDWNTYQTVSTTITGVSTEETIYLRFTGGTSWYLFNVDWFEFSSSPGVDNVAPSVDAGSDQTIQLPTDQVALDGTVTDDGLPGDTLTTTWEKVSGPGTVTFDDPGAVDTTATFSDPGSYVLRLTADDTALSGSAEVQIELLEDPYGGGMVVAAINCGGNAYTATDGTVYSADTGFSGGNTIGVQRAISGTQDDPLYQSLRYGDLTYSIPVENGNYQVTLKMAEGFKSVVGQRLFDVSIEGSLVLDDLDIFAESGFDVAYDRTFSTTVSDGALTIDLVTVQDNALINAILVVSSESAVNTAPVVDAGTDQTIELPTDQVALNGVVTDDDLPSGATLSNNWSMVSGPDTVTFGNAAAANTTATFSTEGTYVLRLTANDGELSSSDDVQITVEAEPVVNFSEWIAAYEVGAQNAAGDDPDGDGVPNLLEFAYGTSPTSGGSYIAVPAGAMVESSEGDYMTLTYRRLTGGTGTTGVDYTVSGITYTVEYENDLTLPLWRSGGLVPVGEPIDNGDGTETVTVRLPDSITSETKLFMRLKVTLVAP